MKNYFPTFITGFNTSDVKIFSVNAKKGITRKLLLFALSFTMFSFQVIAQQITVSGKVVDSRTQAVLPGATVTVTGKSGGTTADKDGWFNIKAVVGDQLNVQSVGYSPELVTVTGSDLTV
ncbi:MAG TPA: carboxypeptidase-like regulatory domain-containing protein, partial [Hanamia sp.]|nr:carboxypeptidase-like regulatory domain-containing protein [Hanamia sp.]